MIPVYKAKSMSELCRFVTRDSTRSLEQVRECLVLQHDQSRHWTILPNWELSEGYGGCLGTGVKKLLVKDVRFAAATNAGPARPNDPLTRFASGSTMNERRALDNSNVEQEIQGQIAGGTDLAVEQKSQYGGCQASARLDTCRPPASNTFLFGSNVIAQQSRNIALRPPSKLNSR